MSFFSNPEWENIAVQALTAAASRFSMDAPVEAFREEFKRATANAEREWHSRYEESAEQQRRRGLQYDKVAFNPYYRMTNYWPDEVMVHQRRPGKNQTMCGIHFEMSMPFSLVDESAGGCLKGCGVCTQLGMTPFKTDAVLWVQRRKRPARI